ncbi:glycoside hydrolase family 20 zincin-like fold domain-containing protein [Flavihumibacter fluvii]|uniref:glycoside hydrolase family 20 zincin-like fold domain-containing protein n=1 Tax=Flavihumibacter fluvii TaxID=2838157 RepID=UPI001BDDCE5B|nr:glycoside hydrolase family 20 zincin-like fold domain-containing protein [Flavihumibacter fluvii]ULQ52096.1 beta-N-acetylhexosaminidase [Flavihumibacter fluvii]
MRYFSLAAAIFILYLPGHAQQRNLLYPQPAKISYTTGSLPLNKVSAYLPADPDLAFSLKEFSKAVETLTGRPVKRAPSALTASLKYTIRKKGLILPDTAAFLQQDNREAYTLQVDKTGIAIDANTSTGFYYAIQTLRQLIEKDGSLPFVQVSDSPALPFRGVMMDFAHGGLLKVAEIKQQIDFLAQWKTNQYYFYNEVSIQLDGYAQMNYKQAYSKAEIREIISYGKERHMDVIPFVAFYGHLHDFLKLELYADKAIGRYGHELDPRNAGVGPLLADWIKQYAALFPSPFIHVGFDETWETNRMAIEGDSAVHAPDLWLKHLINVRAELKKYGKKVLAWTDMSKYYPGILSKFPDDEVPVVWEYSPDSAAMYSYLDPVLKSGRKFIIQPAVSGWGHIYPNTKYTYDNIDLCLRVGMKEGTKGFITSVWTDAVEPLVRPSWSFMAYGCISAWQGVSPGRPAFEKGYNKIVFPAAASEVEAATAAMATAVDLLQTCFGKNTGNMPGGTIIESWSNPFDSYYLGITRANTATLKQVRIQCETAEALLIRVLSGGCQADSTFIESLRVSAKLLHYQATRFLWAAVIADRWDNAMLVSKQNNFVFYDISYICHGLIQDVMDELGTLKDDYSAAWSAENLPYRKHTILSRFDVEFGLWQKLLLKVIDYRIKHSADMVAGGSFTDTFQPGF